MWSSKYSEDIKEKVLEMYLHGEANVARTSEGREIKGRKQKKTAFCEWKRTSCCPAHIWKCIHRLEA